MKLIEYFKIKIKKPTLSEEEKQKENLKKNYISQLESASSRLESLEILVSNNKNRDSYILGTHLSVDLYNLFADLYKYARLNSIAEIKASISSIPNPEVKDLFQKCEFISKFDNSIEPNDDVCEEMENSLFELLRQAEKQFNASFRSDLFTPMDEFKKRWKVQTAVMALILFGTLANIVVDAIRKPTIRQDHAQFYYTVELNSNYSEERSVRVPLDLKTKGQWQEIVFDIPEGTKPFYVVRFDPLNQAKAKFTLGEIKYISAAGKIIYQRDFKITESMFPSNTKELGDFHDFRPGKNNVGGYMEMVTTGTDPYVTFDLPSQVPVAKVVFKIRILEDFKKFEDQIN